MMFDAKKLEELRQREINRTREQLKKEKLEQFHAKLKYKIKNNIKTTTTIGSYYEVD